ncbi:MAG: electron transporter [Bacteroidetes bacterium SW_9_63_38]|nr:MAG: electron transporter [Bacteroidetes bacterium SW_9_63_38]
MSLRALLLTSLVAAFGWVAIPPLFGPDTYVGQGRVAGIQNDTSITIGHDRIPGYMPAMIMPFRMPDPGVPDHLSAGDAIEFQLTVSGKTAAITALRKLPDGAVARHPARTTTVIDTTQEFSVLKTGDRVPVDLAFITQSGDSLRLGDYRGQTLILTFIYTRCPLPNYCPEMSKNFAALQPRLREAYGDNAQLLSISFDPAHDTPPVLRDYADRYTDRLDTWTFVTGDTTTVQRATHLFGVHTQPGDDERGEFLHNLTTAVIGPDGTVHRLFRSSDWTRMMS